MGLYLNPGNDGFFESVSSEIYIDKTGLIRYTNRVFRTRQKFICVSRPRRFGKSMAAEMLAAYYQRNCNSRELFADKDISSDSSFLIHLNKYNTIFLNMQDFFSRTHNIDKMCTLLSKYVLRDLLREYPDLDYLNRTDIIDVLQEIYSDSRIPFVFIIDEWDCIFRENKKDTEAQKKYLDFLRNLLKDRNYVGLTYMTGILPIKKYGSHSALNMFDEFSMTNPGTLAEYVGFTEKEVKGLCKRFDMDFDETRRWYDGYYFKEMGHIYNPRSVVSAMLNRSFDNYWNKTETFEALRDYIIMNYKGLKENIIELLAGKRQPVDVSSFSNDMTTFSSADDILTLFIHLGYLGYDFSKKEVFIPNSEITTEFVTSIRDAGWQEVILAIKNSEELLQATWKRENETVAEKIQEAHFETSILTYNDENALACVISLAYYSARTYYTEIRELPSGKGFADIVYLPRKEHLDKPAMIIELKWNKDAESAINQIKERNYPHTLKDYQGNLLMVGINYNPKTKVHECLIERLAI